MNKRGFFATVAAVALLVTPWSVSAVSAGEIEPDSDKAEIIEQLRAYVPTAEEVAAYEAFLEDEQRRIAYQELLPEAVSPGLYYPQGSDVPVIMVYSNADLASARVIVDGFDSALSLLVSRYQSGEIPTLHALLPKLVKENVSFGAAYEADHDAFVINGNVEASDAEVVLGEHYYEIEYVEDGGAVRQTKVP